MITSSPEAKVGLITITAIIAMLSLFMWLNGAHLLEKGAQFEAVFERIDGLRAGAPVKYIGVDVGRITKIYFDDQKVVVAFYIKPDLQLPKRIEANIASSGVVGDKYLELRPLPADKPNLTAGRIPGNSPPSMEQFYASASEVLNSVQKITHSLSELVGDPEVTQSIKDIISRLDHLSASFERIASNSEPQVYQLLENINLASLRLAEASLKANRLLTQLDNDGQTAAELHETLDHVKNVSQNLDRFSQILAENDSNIPVLMDDAHQAMQSINQAAQTIDKTLKSFSDEGNPSNLQETINQAETAVKKVDTYIAKFEKISFSQSLGANYQHSEKLGIDYAADLVLNDQDALQLVFEDIGDENLTSLQYSSRLSNRNYRARAGLYKNEFGVGLDYSTNPHWNLSMDAWDTDSVNLGISSHWKLFEKWSLSLSTSTNLDTNDDSWNIKWWRRF